MGSRSSKRWSPKSSVAPLPGRAENPPNRTYPAFSFDEGDRLAPRLGFPWNTTGNVTWKLCGSFGRYSDITEYEMPREAFGGDTWVDNHFTFETADPFLNNNP